MFDSSIEFYGKHAEYLQLLAPDRRVATEFRSKTIFNSIIEVVVAAAPIGFLCGRKGKETRQCVLMQNNNSDYKKTIFSEQVRNYRDALEKNYRMIMLLEDKEYIPIEKRLNRAFKYDDDLEARKVGDSIFREYILGGIEILYEDLIKDTNGRYETFMKCVEFVTDCKEYGKGEYSPDAVVDLCNKIDELIKRK